MLTEEMYMNFSSGENNHKGQYFA